MVAEKYLQEKNVANLLKVHLLNFNNVSDRQMDTHMNSGFLGLSSAFAKKILISVPFFGIYTAALHVYSEIG